MNTWAESGTKIKRINYCIQARLVMGVQKVKEFWLLSLDTIKLRAINT